MKTFDYIPTNDRQFYQWVIVFLNYLFNALQRLMFPNEVYNSLAGMRDDFGGKLDAAENPATRTKLTVQAKNDARTALERAVRQAVKEYLTHNHAVTNEDRDGLGIPIHKSGRTPAPVATDPPDSDVDTSVLGHVTVYAYEKGSNHKKAKPAGQHGFETGWAILDAPTTEWSDLTHSSFDTNSPLTLSFEGHDRGKTLYYALRWENTRGEKGPWSEIKSVIIP